MKYDRDDVASTVHESRNGELMLLTLVSAALATALFFLGEIFWAA